eukprot:g12206.t1
MLPPVRHRTQMGDILSWGGGRNAPPPNAGEQNPNAPQNPNPQSGREIVIPPQFAPPGQIAAAGGGNGYNLKPSYLQLQPTKPPAPPSAGENNSSNHGNNMLIDGGGNGNLLNLHPSSGSSASLAAVHSQGLQNQIFSLERVLRLIKRSAMVVLGVMTDRVTFLENKASNVSQQLDERGRTDAEILRKLQLQVRELQDGQTSFVKDVASKLTQHEEQGIRGEREHQSVKESVRGLQNDFRDFAVQSVYRQRQETEQLIKAQFAKHQFQENDHRAELKRHQEDMAESLQRLNNVIEDLDHNSQSFKTDARARIVNLENAILCREDDDGSTKLGGFAFREHVEQLRAQVSQIAKDFTENVIENENDRKIRGAVLRRRDQRWREVSITALLKCVWGAKRGLGLGRFLEIMGSIVIVGGVEVGGR